MKQMREWRFAQADADEVNTGSLAAKALPAHGGKVSLCWNTRDQGESSVGDYKPRLERQRQVKRHK